MTKKFVLKIHIYIPTLTFARLVILSAHHSAGLLPSSGVRWMLLILLLLLLLIVDRRLLVLLRWWSSFLVGNGVEWSSSYCNISPYMLMLSYLYYLTWKFLIYNTLFILMFKTTKPTQKHSKKYVTMEIDVRTATESQKISQYH